MCFSASASFGAGLVLSIAGVVTLRIAKKRSVVIFAFIPILFAVQQITEGFVWVCLSTPSWEPWQDIPIAIFLFLSHVLWPVWMPLSIWLLEKRGWRKKILFTLLCLGILLAIYHFYFIVTYTPKAEILSCHIDYITSFPESLMLLSAMLYGLTTIIPTLISSSKRMWMMGVVLTIAYVVSKLFYEAYLVSVFCFFAALMSIVVYLILRKNFLHLHTS